MKKKFIIAAVLAVFCGILFEMIFDFSRPPHFTMPSKYNNNRSDYNQSLSLPSQFECNSYEAMNYDKPVGAWISYIELSQMLKNADEDSFRKDIGASFDKLSQLGVNTVYVHVRAFSDAYYPSQVYPYANVFGDSEPFDALSIMIEQAHSRNLSFHAWINPLRCPSENKVSQISDFYEIKKIYKSSAGEMIVEVADNPYMWLNPAYSDVRKLVSLGAAEIVSKYDVDAIHIDDYFYPTISDSFDKIAFTDSGASDINEWRMDNINKLVMSINTEIKKVNPSVLFEISPQGNINNNYNQMYADVKKWCSSSTLFCDVIIPQVYFGYNSSSPYLETIGKWSEMTQNNTRQKLVIGLGVYKIAEENEFKNTDRIIAKQIQDAMSLDGVDGIALYGYSMLFDENELKEKMESEREAISEAVKKQNNT